jgi:Protein of unknown function (DUF4058)
MPSPMPGVDPSIEAPDIWSDFDGDLAAEMRAELNRVLQPRYVARLTPARHLRNRRNGREIQHAS